MNLAGASFLAAEIQERKTTGMNRRRRTLNPFTNHTPPWALNLLRLQANWSHFAVHILEHVSSQLANTEFSNNGATLMYRLFKLG